MTISQLTLPLTFQSGVKSYYERLADLLTRQNLDFHTENSNYSAHNFHSFPAKFPPQLPLAFINGLTDPGDIVLDPMMGSGTTILEACLNGRQGIGFDIDPLAVMIAQVKSTTLDPIQVALLGKSIHRKAIVAVSERSKSIVKSLDSRWDRATKEFVDYWFDADTQIGLMALLHEIEKIDDIAIRVFFQLAISGIIITKSGGVSLALDLAHTRPHRAKLVYSQKGEILEGSNLLHQPPSNLRYVTKTLRSPIEEFDKRVQNNLKGLLKPGQASTRARVYFGNAQNLPMPANYVDLIVTSPPYASNAIDYMRAHKFSLVWFGNSISDLSQKRDEYIGGENLTNVDRVPLPPYSSQIVAEISSLDSKKGQVLHRYYSEMTDVLKEMYRLLKPGKAAIVVVGNSLMRGRDTETQNCLADIGRAIGFQVAAIGVRNLDRNRRMLPAGLEIDRNSQIQQRMHEEYVIGFYKPE